MPVTDLVVKRRRPGGGARRAGASGSSTTSRRCGRWRRASRAKTRTCSARVPPRATSRRTRRRASGQNPPSGAVLYYWLRAEPKEKEEIALDVVDSADHVVRHFTNKDEEEGRRRAALRRRRRRRGRHDEAAGQSGLNRFVWDLRSPDASKFKGLILWAGGTRGPPHRSRRLHAALHGGRQDDGGATPGRRRSARCPRRPKTTGKQYALLLKLRNKLTETHDAVNRIREVREQVKTVVDHAKTAGGDEAIAKAAEALTKSVILGRGGALPDEEPEQPGPAELPHPPQQQALRPGRRGGQRGRRAHGVVVPGLHDDVAGRIDVELAKLKTILDTDLVAFNQLVKEKGGAGGGPQEVGAI